VNDRHMRARILIVEDDESLITLFQRILVTQATELGSIQRPHQIPLVFREFKPDIVAMDLMMPHLDSVAVMQQQVRGRMPADDFVPILR
jgi:DNA-binding response OmpR family regulator